MHEGQEPTRFTMPNGLAELQAELEQTWPTMQTALLASGVPLMDEPEQKPEPEAEPEPKPKPDPKPPWGEDKDFDPQKAWSLIQNVRGDVDKIKTERDELAKKVSEHEDASKSDAQKLEERATTAEQQLTATQREAARLRIALKKGLTETQAKRLVGDTEEELEKDADDLLESFKDDEREGDGASARRTPKPKLRPGAAPSAEPDETDPEKLAAQVPRMFRT